MNEHSTEIQSFSLSIAFSSTQIKNNKGSSRLLHNTFDYLIYIFLIRINNINNNNNYALRQEVNGLFPELKPLLRYSDELRGVFTWHIHDICTYNSIQVPSCQEER